MTNKKCNDNCSCSHVDGKVTAHETSVNTKNKNTCEKETINYGFYSKVLQKPFDSLSELKAAEAAYQAEQKAKEDAAAKKKADATKVEDAFKALNAARKTYKEDLTQLTKEYAEALDNIKKAFELGKKDIHNKLAEAETAFDKAQKDFTDKQNIAYQTAVTASSTIAASSTMMAIPAYHIVKRKKQREIATDTHEDTYEK